MCADQETPSGWQPTPEPPEHSRTNPTNVARMYGRAPSYPLLGAAPVPGSRGSAASQAAIQRGGAGGACGGTHGERVQDSPGAARYRPAEEAWGRWRERRRGLAAHTARSPPQPTEPTRNPSVRAGDSTVSSSLLCSTGTVTTTATTRREAEEVAPSRGDRPPEVAPGQFLRLVHTARKQIDSQAVVLQ